MNRPLLTCDDVGCPTCKLERRAREPLPQPAPSPLDPRRTPVFASALARLAPGPFRDLVAAREAVGVATYGESLHSHNGRDALRDTLEELADAFVYLEQLRLEGVTVTYVGEKGTIYLDLIGAAQTHVLNAEHVLAILRGVK